MKRVLSNSSIGQRNLYQNGWTGSTSFAQGVVELIRRTVPLPLMHFTNCSNQNTYFRTEKYSILATFSSNMSSCLLILICKVSTALRTSSAHFQVGERFVLKAQFKFRLLFYTVRNVELYLGHDMIRGCEQQQFLTKYCLRRL